MASLEGEISLKSLREVYKQTQSQMAAKLKVSSEAVFHSGEKGGASETDWIEWCKQYLPKRYRVDKASVVDSKDNFSDQIDMVIYDAQYSFLAFEHSGVKYVPAESVYCVFEIKQELTKRNLEYAGEKAESVRRLHRTSIPVHHAGGTYPAKALHSIPAGILALRSSWSDPLGDAFKESILSLVDDNSLQLGCVINEGAFSISNNGVIEISQKDVALISFYFKLLSCLQSIATVPAIDIKAYERLL
jgi:DNA-binding XRE family transcriptional regulator